LGVVQQEYNSLIKNDTCSIVEAQPDRKPVGCKWVFILKVKADGSIDHYKARLVAKGYS
jgi:hypothetical protein